MLAGRYDHQCRWPALCCDCLPEICINKLPVPACPRCCPGASAFAYRAVIGLPWVPSATAERVGGRQHHKWVLNWNLTAALHFMCVEARSKAESDQRGEKKIKDKKGSGKKMEAGKWQKAQITRQTTAPIGITLVVCFWLLTPEWINHLSTSCNGCW